MTKDRSRYSNPSRQTEGRGIWSWDVFVFGLTRGAYSPRERTHPCHARDRRY